MELLCQLVDMCAMCDSISLSSYYRKVLRLSTNLISIKL